MGQLQPNKKGNFLSSRKPGDFLTLVLLDLGFDVPARKRREKETISVQRCEQNFTKPGLSLERLEESFFFRILF